VDLLLVGLDGALVGGVVRHGPPWAKYRSGAGSDRSGSRSLGAEVQASGIGGCGDAALATVMKPVCATIR